MSQLGTIELIFLLLLLFIVVFGVVAEKLRTPYPIIMVIGGLLLSFVPGIPSISLNSDLIFLVVLPPLLYSAAWTTSWRDFRYNFASIVLLAFGLVGFTVLGVAWIAPKVFSAFDWRLGLVLGAIVAPTDAIAATSIARQVGLPGRLLDVLEGESLINDATGLLALEFATGIVVHRTIPTLSTGVLTFLWLVAGGIVIGLIGGWVVRIAERWIDHGPIEIALSILTPYTVYLAADRLGASGVLAVVACGLFLARQSADFFSPAVRLEVWSVWRALTFILNGLVFVLIGLQLTSVRASISEMSGSSLLMDGAIFSILLILLRMVWVYPSAGIAYFLRTRVAHQKETYPPPREVFVVGWTGMRGVLSLAAAIALPATIADGTAFPHRNLIVFLTFTVIVVTLVVQGTTLPPLIRALGLSRSIGPSCEEQEARKIVLESAVSHLETVKKNDSDETLEIYEHLQRHYQQRLAVLQPEEADESDVAKHLRYLELSLEALRVERTTAISLRNNGRINDEVLRRIERELDLVESRLDFNE